MTDQAPNGFDLAIVCAPSEEDWVYALLRDLETTYGLRCFFPARDVRPGAIIRDGLRDGIEASRRVAFVVSPASVTDAYAVLAKAIAALPDTAATNRTLIPLYRVDCGSAMPSDIAILKGIDFRDHDRYKEHLEGLVRELKDFPVSGCAELAPPSPDEWRGHAMALLLEVLKSSSGPVTLPAPLGCGDGSLEDEHRGTGDPELSWWAVNNPTIEDLVNRIEKNMGFVVLSGPQLIGKSWHARGIVNAMRRKGGTPAVVYAPVSPEQVKAHLETCLESDPSRKKFPILLYAVWARLCVWEAIYGNGRFSLEERKAIFDNPLNSYLNKYLFGSFDFVLKDLENRAKPLGGPAAERSLEAMLGIMEDSVLKALSYASLDHSDILLAVEVDSLHRYEEGDVGSALGDEMLKSFVHAFDSVPWLSKRRPRERRRPLKIIVTTRPLRKGYRLAGESHRSVVHLGLLNEEQCRAITESALGGILTEGEAEAVSLRLHYWTGGYPWFARRFLSAVAFARARVPSMPVGDLTDLVEGSPVFWYYRNPFGDDFGNFANSTLRGEFPSSADDESPFLSTVREALWNRDNDVLAWYTQVGSGEINYRGQPKEVQEFYLRLHRAGLVYHDKEDNRYDYYNRIVERFFSAARLKVFLDWLRELREAEAA